AKALEHGHPFPAQHADLTRLHAGREVELDRPLERLAGHRRAERRLDDRQVDLGIDVVALAYEPRVRAHVDEHVDVSRSAAERTGVTLARKPDPLPVVDARGHVDAELALLDGAA